MTNSHPERCRFMPTLQEAGIASNLSHSFICISKGNRGTVSKAIIYQHQILSIYFCWGRGRGNSTAQALSATALVNSQLCSRRKSLMSQGPYLKQPEFGILDNVCLLNLNIYNSFNRFFRRKKLKSYASPLVGSNRRSTINLISTKGPIKCIDSLI